MTRAHYIKLMLVTVVAATAFSGVAVRAEETPRGGFLDARVRVVDYNESQVYKLNGVFRSATQIIFGNGEEIATAALGDTISWEIAPAENMLFLKPRDDAGPTNLIVVTKAGNLSRTYHFALAARSGAIGQDSGAIFQVKFRYPREEAAQQAAEAGEAALMQALQIEAGAVKLALDSAASQGPRNLNYIVAGSTALEPSEITDNGQFTVMRFPRGQAIPSIFTVNEDGSEAIVPYDVRDEFVVIHQVASQFRLRRGNTLLCIWNRSLERYGPDMSSGSASPYVERIIERTQDRE
jgi:type IV secretion system protein VirB9